MTPEQVRINRELREARAAIRAEKLPPGYYSAYNNQVICNVSHKPVMGCESHWDACLVLLAINK
jgi:hypothetical protein